MTGNLAKTEAARRLRWQCRRGMLELDVVLNRFLELGYGELAEDERTAFAKLLACQDQIIHEWILGHEVPTSPEICALVGKIRRIGG